MHPFARIVLFAVPPSESLCEHAYNAVLLRIKTGILKHARENIYRENDRKQYLEERHEV